MTEIPEHAIADVAQILSPVIQIRNLNKSFGGNHVLKNFNLDLFKGESIVVLGKSGSGK